MAEPIRSFGSIFVGFAGNAIGGPLGFAVATVLFNLVFPAKTPDVGGGLGTGGGNNQNTAVDTPIHYFAGHYMRDGGECLRCSKDDAGYRTGIHIRKKTKSTGGSGGGGSQKTTTEKQYLRASFGLAEGPGYIDKVIEINSQNGQRVLFDRTGVLNYRGSWSSGKNYAVADKVGLSDDNTDDRWRCIVAHTSNADTKPLSGADWQTYWVATTSDSNKYDFSPIYGPVSGDIIGYVSESIRLYFGTEEQPIDDAEETWDYDNGVSADRGIIKAVFNDEGPLESGTTYRFELSNDTRKARDVIVNRLNRAGIPDSRVYLRSIPADVEDFGWFTTSIEPARQLAEQVAGFHFHDLHFMSTERGMVFTDISRANPTIITIEDWEMGAFANSGGGGEFPSSSTSTLQSNESKPRTMKVSFKNWNKYYKDDGVTIHWTQANGEGQSVTLNGVHELNRVFDFGEVSMRELQGAEGTTQITLMPGRMQIGPGIVLNVPEPSETEPNGRRLLRVASQRISPEGVLACSCTPYDPAAYDDVDSLPVDVEPPPVAPNYANPQLLWLDGVSLTREMANQPTMLNGGRVANGYDFGTVNVVMSTGDITGPLLSTAAVCGSLNTPYSFDPNVNEYDFDYDTVLEIQIDDGGFLASTTEDAVLSNLANVLWIGGVYVAFTTASAMTPNIYHITGLMPGMAGSDFITELAAGARVVKVTDETGEQDGGIEAVAWTRRRVNSSVGWTAENTANTRKRSSGNITCIAQNMRVLSPSPHVIVGGDGAGGYTLRFWARSRVPDNSVSYWESGLSPEHLDPFSYTVELLSGGSVVNSRTITSDSPEATAHYTETELIGYYGSMPMQLTGRIYGENDYGPGFERTFTVDTTSALVMQFDDSAIMRFDDAGAMEFD